MKAKATKKKYQEGGEEAKEYMYSFNKKTKNKKKEKEITENRANRLAYRYSKQEGSKSGKDFLGRDIIVSGKNPKKSVTRMEDTRPDYTEKRRVIPKIFKTGGEAGTGKYVSGVQTYGPGYRGNPNSPKPFVGVAPAKRKGGSVKSKKK